MFITSSTTFPPVRSMLRWVSRFALPSFLFNFVTLTKENHLPVQTFKDHMIDGETLPLLSEEHLLDTLGLKLGPALKIRSQVISWHGYGVM